MVKPQLILIINQILLVHTYCKASLDISFNDLYEDILSPQSTLQRIGRCDRFGNCIGESVINIIKESPKVKPIKVI
jgi:CRISPR/Cas system-associated endonuclease/helicase Cas3